jgi:RNA polymerase sigma-70 factor (ECF subfamily)
MPGPDADPAGPAAVPGLTGVPRPPDVLDPPDVADLPGVPDLPDVPGPPGAPGSPGAPGPAGAADLAGVTGLSAAVAHAQHGSPEAFRALYRDTQPRLLRYLHALVGDDAEDIASETWLHVTRDLHTFHGDHDGFRGWVTTIARHRALDHLRRSSRRPPSDPVPAEDLAGLPAADDTAARALDAVATHAAVRLIATLPPDQAEAVLLRAVVGLDATTAAQVLGKRPGAVRTAAYRGLRTLARHLNHAEPASLA